MRFTSDDLTRKDKIELLQRWIIVHSILYYELDFSLVRDKVFDANCQQLVKLMSKSNKTLPTTHYHYCMHDFDGSTGFDLYQRLNKRDRKHLSHIAKYLKRTYKGVK